MVWQNCRTRRRSRQVVLQPKEQVATETFVRCRVGGTRISGKGGLIKQDHKQIPGIVNFIINIMG